MARICRRCRSAPPPGAGRTCSNATTGASPCPTPKSMNSVHSAPACASDRLTSGSCARNSLPCRYWGPGCGRYWQRYWTGAVLCSFTGCRCSAGEAARQLRHSWPSVPTWVRRGRKTRPVTCSGMSGTWACTPATRRCASTRPASGRHSIPIHAISWGCFVCRQPARAASQRWSLPLPCSTRCACAGPILPNACSSRWRQTAVARCRRVGSRTSLSRC